VPVIDYRASLAALHAFRDVLASASFSDPSLIGRRDAQILEFDNGRWFAVLGALTPHLLWHAASDGTELNLAERAATLWRAGLELYKLIGKHRADLEGALADPTNPDAGLKFNRAMQTRDVIAAAMAGKEAQIAILRDDIYNAGFPGPHPRQEDEALKHWTWADVFLARRTDAFARAIWIRASDMETSAFAFGVMSSYGANVCGSAYLGQVVGGPRRSHRYRDRLARNAVGSWFALNQPASASLRDLADTIQFGLLAPTLPSSIETLLTNALTETYDMGRTPPLPDLQLGYGRLIRHLRALDSFRMPEPPALPQEPFLSKIFADPASQPFSVVQAAISAAANPIASGGGGGVTPLTAPGNPPQSGSVGAQDSKSNSKLDCGAFLEALAIWSILSIVLFGPCWEDWANGRDCKIWEKMKQDWADWWASMGGGQGAGVSQTGSNTGFLTTGGLAAASQSSQVTDLIYSLYDLHNRCWEALNAAAWYLARTGLIYPDELLSRKVFAGFLTTPPSGGWPRKQVADPAEQSHLYPTTAIEQPAVNPAYPPGSKPDVFVGRPGIAEISTAGGLSLHLWEQTASGNLDGVNFDMDSDRGLDHACWNVSGSINDTPIGVITLDYTDT
jgi:hypothetical protein